MAPTPRTEMTRWHRRGPFGVLTLHAPPGNLLPRPDALDPDALSARLAEPGLKGVVVAGEGRHFCAGADLEALERASDDLPSLERALLRGAEALRILENAPVPTVAAVRGSCLGAGLEIALACLYRFAAPRSVLGLPETGRGLAPGLGGTARLAALLPREKAAELVLTGRLLPAGEAAELGLVHRVVDGDVVACALEWLEDLTGPLSPAAVRAVLTTLHAARTGDEREAARLGASFFCRLAGGEEGA